MRDGFIDSIIPYLRGEIKGKVLHVTVKAQALFAEVSSCRSASNNKGEAVGFSFVVWWSSIDNIRTESSDIGSFFAFCYNNSLLFDKKQQPTAENDRLVTLGGVCFIDLLIKGTNIRYHKELSQFL